MGLSVSLVAEIGPHGALIGERHQCVGVDVTATGPAPSNEIVRADVRLDGPDALVLEALERLFGGGVPLAVGGMPSTFGKDAAK